MKKLLFTVTAVLLSVLALTACAGSKVTIDDIKTAFTGASYTTSAPAAQTGTKGSFGATKGTTVVAVYEFNKESEADALVTVTEAAALISKAKVSKKNKVFVCVATDLTSDSNAAAAITIFNGCF